MRWRSGARGNLDAYRSHRRHQQCPPGGAEGQLHRRHTDYGVRVTSSADSTVFYTVPSGSGHSLGVRIHDESSIWAPSGS